MQKAKLIIRLSAAGRHASSAVLFVAIAAVAIWGARENVEVAMLTLIGAAATAKLS